MLLPAPLDLELHDQSAHFIFGSQSPLALRAGTLLEFPRGDRQAQRRKKGGIKKQSSPTLHLHAMIWVPSSFPRCEDFCLAEATFQSNFHESSSPMNPVPPVALVVKNPSAQCRDTCQVRCWFNFGQEDP